MKSKGGTVRDFFCVTFNEKLAWNDHTDAVKAKMSRNAGILGI